MKNQSDDKNQENLGAQGVTVQLSKVTEVLIALMNKQKKIFNFQFGDNNVVIRQ